MSLYVTESGPAAAPTIIFLHGGGTRGWSWQPQVERLPLYHCLVPDLPDHGHSSGSGPFTMGQAAALVADLIRSRAHGGHAHVVGLSLGAQLAVQLMSDAPDVVQRVVLSGTSVRPIRGGRAVTALANVYMPVRNNPALIRANMRAVGIPARYADHFTEDTRLLSAAMFANMLHANMRFRLPAALVGSPIPTLILVGERETRLLRRSARDLRAALPLSQSYVVRGVGHNWNLEASDLFSQTVRAWLAEQPLPPALVPLL